MNLSKPVMLAMLVVVCPKVLQAADPNNLCSLFPNGYRLSGTETGTSKATRTAIPTRPANPEIRYRQNVGILTGESGPAIPRIEYQYCAGSKPGTVSTGGTVFKNASPQIALKVAQEECYRANEKRTEQAPDATQRVYREECARTAGLGEVAFEGSLASYGHIYFYRGPYVVSLGFVASTRAEVLALGAAIDNELKRWLAGSASLGSGIIAAGASPSPAGVQPRAAADSGGWPNGRTSNQPTRLAFDGDTSTFTWTTESFNSANPSYLGMTFAAATSVSRIRLYKDNDACGPGLVAKNLVIEYTTSDPSVPLASRTWKPVTGLANGFNGAERMTAASINPDTGTVSGDNHDSRVNGWASLTFTPVNMTGLRIGFSNAAPISVNHYRVYELQAYGPSTQVMGIR